ncbi:MAG TPA: multicopper oxidase domain-containing protein [Acidimicrobiales bacterium]|nr:multicopper oxidase domain-containing protein [Acidimicrobiales bacterium]
MQTTLPPPRDGAPPPADRTAGVAAFGVVIAVLALVFASVAVVFGGDDGSQEASPGAGGGTAALELSEFALTPAALTVSTGGSLEVTNAGTAAHNLTVSGTDIASSDLAAGESETLDLSSLEAGDYEVICAIPGHADAGMKGTLTISDDGQAGAASGLSTSGAPEAGSPDGAHAGHQMGAEEYRKMSEAMNATIADYPAETEGAGNQVLEPTVQAGGIKEFELTAKVTPWEVEPGTKVDAWTYNGTVPGPQIRVDVGDRVRIVLHNELPMGTDLHLHGIDVDNAMDGVAPITQSLVEPGESFTYEFVADEPAVAMYHAHHHGQLQVPNGMLGTIFVGEVALPAGRTVSGHAIPAGVKVAQELPLVLNDSGVIGYSLNGKSFPATAPIAANRGDWILVHYFNEGGQIHPMHLHQFDQVVVAKDGFPLDHPYVADTVNVAPGERYSVLVHLDKPGTWVWHCHILNHVERDTGMFGMVTAVVVS